jgi:YVTN family beta-propeller protein
VESSDGECSFETAPGGDVAIGEGGVRVVQQAEDTVIRIDQATGVAASIEVGNAPLNVAIGGGALWVTNSSDGTVSKIDADNPSHVARIRVGGSPEGIAFGGGSVWVTVAGLPHPCCRYRQPTWHGTPTHVVEPSAPTKSPNDHESAPARLMLAGASFITAGPSAPDRLAGDESLIDEAPHEEVVAFEDLLGNLSAGDCRH